MTTLIQTSALQTFSKNLIRLDRFLQLAKSLELNDAEVFRIRKEFFWQTTEDELIKIRDEAVTSKPALETNKPELLKEVTKLQKEREEGFIAEQMSLYHRLRNELTIIQLVSIADGYRNEATTLLFRKKTSSLVRHKTEIVKVLSDTPVPLDWNELYEDIIRVAVNQMTRTAKYRSWIDRIKNDFSLTPSVNGDDIDNIEEIIATRNVLAHNAGIVNRDYEERAAPHYRRTGQTAPVAGSLRHIDQVYCTSAAQCFERVIHAIDAEVYRVTI